MAVDKLVDSAQLDADLTSVANAIRTKGGTSASLAFPSGFVSAVEAIETGGGSAVTGTFSPASNLRSVTLTDCIGKSNIAIYPISALVNPASGRTHYGGMIINDTTHIYVGSSNSGGSGWSLTKGSTQSSWDNATGTYEIDALASANYGGYFTAGMTYGYVAW